MVPDAQRNAENGNAVRNNTPFVKINGTTDIEYTDAENLKRQENGLRWLLEKHLGNRTSEAAADFKTLPEDASIVETYGNDTTRAALLYFAGDDFYEECYYINTSLN